MWIVMAILLSGVVPVVLVDINSVSPVTWSTTTRKSTNSVTFSSWKPWVWIRYRVLVSGLPFLSLTSLLVPTTSPYFPTTNGAALIYSLIGTGTFGRVLLCKLKTKDQYFAMKMLKKVEVVRLKQVEHINSEKEILSQINFPYIVNL